MKRNRAAFTLIELLIVVAIIAILAAIAIPNFLEAQVRSKVARVKSDLRTLATAQEAYFVDWNSYTFRDQGDNLDGTYTDGFRQLTTPIAYTTSVPRDAFGDYRYQSTQRRPLLEMGTGSASTRQGSGGTQSNQALIPNPQGQPADVWIMCSSGPDRYDDTEANHPPAMVELGERTFPWPHLADTPAVNETILTLVYDPTNGTVSGGQVYRTGGSKPRMRIYDTLFSGSCK